ncbi:hypothetical protein [Acetobacter ghanensis]|uniref:Uncharacterized protein n=1 Tax=Acetobacter ghanensis TaxID=431306 RepID=A0A0U5F4U0_9PROT|nr:hypothetical protein [Acetobacter ghanensis]NHO38624.1 hypothetical protein [Acetobacter ghanensis]GBQ50130.1 hypothetical protein AA18895_1846 [Acetobacter ghanensis DSM 18895]CEF55177.1 hypothetical protein AGA_1214 [Acetobacter ghanensis]
MKNSTATPALALLVLDVALGVACVLLPPVVMGFVGLLRDVFGVLVLPFSFLFGLAGWSSDLSSLSSVHDGLMPGATTHPLYAVMAAGLLGVGGVCSVLACNTPEGAKVERAVAPIATGLAIVAAGWDPGLIVLPAFVLQILCFWYPTLAFSFRRQ